MKTTIYCVPVEQGIHSFFLSVNSRQYYLFSQKYRKGVHNYFAQGVRLDDATNYARAHHDNAIMRTMSKIPMYIKYIEKEYGMEILEQTKRRNRGVTHGELERCA